MLAGLAALGWLVGTESGLHWAAGRLPHELSVDGLRGKLAREITAGQVVYDRDQRRTKQAGPSFRSARAG